MKITRVETFKFWVDWCNWLLVRISTDEGIVGWGEASLHGAIESVETAIAVNTQQAGQARRNAFMALQLAVGRLQRFAGPDQRVTARAVWARWITGSEMNFCIQEASRKARRPETARITSMAPAALVSCSRTSRRSDSR